MFLQPILEEANHDWKIGEELWDKLSENFPSIPYFILFYVFYGDMDDPCLFKHAVEQKESAFRVL